ncbi:hypothetical protein [Dawidia soli]|uniref:Uncharacterized protein n=1 Tax=Dawidia soli TaxID=2782352 RepID=A0AAP2DB10_9BACT|nr:hypothetical protein [Dawidia soli]MBT1688663.1 hypothetical protein [Dawidia soli]
MTFKEEFADWIASITATEKIPKNIVAFNFGLFQTDKGYGVYLVGAKVYDPDDDDRATADDYGPSEKYLVIPPAEVKKIKWDKVLEKAVAMLEAYVASSDFKKSFLKNAKAITTGFDDGELVRIK